jgi:MFS family permease
MWSVATAACGLAHTFTGLFVARVLVGVGEAALGPASFSLVANLFPKHKLGFALALLATGITLGNGFSVTLGGALVSWTEAKFVVLPFIGLLSGWRLVFLAVGVSGLPLAAIIALLVREPPRQTSAPAPSLPAVFAHMYTHAKTYGLIISGYSFMVVMSFAQIIWGPTFFLRVLHMPLVSFAIYYGLLMGIGGTLGLMAGGNISDSLTRRGVSGAPARVNLTAIILQTPFLIAGYLSRDLAMALLCFGAGVIVLTFTGGLQSATLQRITPPRMLGSVSAIYLIFANLVGGGAGPFFIGALSQHFGASGNGLGQSLAVMSIITLPIAAGLVFLALKPLAESERAAEVVADRLPPKGTLLATNAPIGAYVGDIG